jgi:hypothetical protein
MSTGSSCEVSPGAEQGHEFTVETAVKQNVAELFGGLDEAVQASAESGGSYISLYMTSTDPETGLNRGLFVMTDESFGTDDTAAYHGSVGQLPYSGCSEQLTCVFIEELSPGNLNVKKMEWDVRSGRCQLTEEGLAGLSVTDVIGGEHGWLTRERLARLFGVKSDDFLLSDGEVGPEAVNEFFSEILSPGVLDNARSINLSDKPPLFRAIA